MDNKKGYYLVRSSSDIPWSESVVGVGWDDHDFSIYDDVEELIRKIDSDYGIGRQANQIRRYKSIKRDDVIVVPTWGAVVIGLAGDEEVYDPRRKNSHGSNQRRVNFFTDSNSQVVFVPRNELSQGFQSRCRIRQTIADLISFADELDKIVDCLESGKKYSWDSELAARIGREVEDAKSKLLENIQQGKTNLRAGGIGLEHLVKELFEADGFDAKVLDKQEFKGLGDADVSATRVNFLGVEESFLAQVKHHDGETPEWGVEQLAAIKNSPPDKFPNYRLVLVTSGFVSDKVNNQAANDGIEIMDGKRLMDWLFTHLSALRPETRNALGLIDVPRLLDL